MAGSCVAWVQGEEKIQFVIYLISWGQWRHERHDPGHDLAAEREPVLPVPFCAVTSYSALPEAGVHYGLNALRRNRPEIFFALWSMLLVLAVTPSAWYWDRQTIANGVVLHLLRQGCFAPACSRGIRYLPSCGTKDFFSSARANGRWLA